MKHICVFCGSRVGKGSAYARGATTLASVLVEKRIGLVYGGGSTGMMGTIADAVLAGGGSVIGVVPDGLFRGDQIHENLTELKRVGTMHERKALMSSLADGFIAMPGGIGTLEELFETWTWSQLGIHGSPCGLLNLAGYFDELIAFVEGMVEREFLTHDTRRLLAVESDPQVLVERLLASAAGARGDFSRL